MNSSKKRFKHAESTTRSRTCKEFVCFPLLSWKFTILFLRTTKIRSVQELLKKGMFWISVLELGPLDHHEILMRVSWALVWYVLQDKIFIYTLWVMCLLDRCSRGRTMIVIIGPVFICPRPCLESLNGRFCLGFSSRRLVVVKYFVVHFECLVRLFWFTFEKYVYSAKVSCPVSPNMPIDRVFKSVYLQLNK